MQQVNSDQSNQTTSSANDSAQVWERELLTRLAMSSLNEQRRSRRWRSIFWFLVLMVTVVMFVTLAKLAGNADISTGPHTAIVRVEGVIASNPVEANADAIIQGLRNAFKHENTRGVILRINSPGGSPVQASYVYDEMLRLRNKYPNIPLYAVIEDIGASGGYFIAAGAEKIYANRSSIVGSIGVRMDNFGFVDAIEKLGIERRLMTAGKDKGLLDPFLPEDELGRQHIQVLLDEVHKHFIDAVKNQRGERLAANEELFTGLFWSGERSVALGLIDELGGVDYVAREVIGEENIHDFTVVIDPLSRFFMSMGSAMVKVVEAQLQPKMQ
ncbi:MAG: S49 family peptidase [Gammaproteobacteria bacterium]|nr:S49 family peptidase [Gammaproteobacteria bacterium]